MVTDYIRRTPQASAGHSKSREAAFVGLFVALMCIGARINIVLPIGSGVTISLQILFALLAGFLLGARRGFESVLIYLAMGLIGLPVYAHGGGLAYLLKPTYGFLIGFAVAALLAGLFREHGAGKSFWKFLLFGELAMLSYYACGLLYLYWMTNVLVRSGSPQTISALLSVWFFSTVGPDLVIGAAACYLAYRLMPVAAQFGLGSR